LIEYQANASFYERNAGVATNDKSINDQYPLHRMKVDTLVKKSYISAPKHEFFCGFRCRI